MGEHYKNEVSQSENIYYVTICGYLFRLLKILCFVMFSLFCFKLSLFAVVYNKIINPVVLALRSKLPLHIKEWKKLQNLMHSHSTFP